VERHAGPAYPADERHQRDFLHYHIGALIQIAPQVPDGTVRPDELIRWIAIVGIALTSINMFGGFAVTRRMLMMFRK